MHLGLTLETGVMLQDRGKNTTPRTHTAIYSHLWSVSDWVRALKNSMASEDGLPIIHPSGKLPVLYRDRTGGWWETKHTTINNYPHSLWSAISILINCFREPGTLAFHSLGLTLTIQGVCGGGGVVKWNKLAISCGNAPPRCRVRPKASVLTNVLKS